MIALGEPLELADVLAVARDNARVALSREVIERVKACRAQIDAIVRDPDKMVYGVNTGFGALAEVQISPDQMRQLQRNLILSHSCGVGEAFDRPMTRAVMLLRAQVLALGHSGVRPELIELLVEMLNRGVHPRIPRRGSVGASGDLAPLAHLALVLIGRGEAELGGFVMAGEEALEKAGLRPLELEAKEGLSLINGTQVMAALAATLWDRARRLCTVADLAGAMSLDALMGTPRAFIPELQQLRPHPGQRVSAANLTRLLSGSAIVDSHVGCRKVQDPYSLRCMPQVHGATRDVVDYVGRVVAIEVNSATDNPLVLADGSVVSGGNFHGQPLAFALDFLAIAVAELANIAERRIEQLVNPHLNSGLPAFLTPEVGLNSGYMIAQVAAASLVAENKVLAHPASVDSIPSSANREDHVSMGVTAGLKAQQIVDNTRTVLATELLCAAQGLDLRRPLTSSPALEAALSSIRSEVSRMEGDRELHWDIRAIARMVDSNRLLDDVTAAGCPLG
ncbi:MAG: histidine ammonia-lyase [Myxococcales bacterium]|nr:histidine ammonia-lyase [Myxococcales bacterium]